ncbi:MAG: FAD-dependent oxidoreductase [Gammaproteobacteria bacterium]|nr:FAD-dependent oxidoreductase [Gammaproteobacteria bacterium]
MKPISDDTIVGGAGLAGLAAAYALASAGHRVRVLERAPTVGGLARTLEHRGQRFDLGGHRLLTDSEPVQRLVRHVVREPLLCVPRSSKILLGGRYVDYPLQPFNAIAGMGLGTTLRILRAYVAAQLAHRLSPRTAVSLEDWVVRHYGQVLFEIFFKPYSEKVWGLDCARISADWVAQRIQGLSLGAAIQRALFRLTRPGPRTLASEFLYPAHGIGGIATGLQAAIETTGRIHTASNIIRVVHRAGRIKTVAVRHGEALSLYHPEAFISSLPLPVLVNRMYPLPPRAVLEAASRLRYRDLLLVAVRLDRERATDQTWIYTPDPRISFGRVHEPKNWSQQMGVAGQTLLVTEHFCFHSDPVWRASDDALMQRSIADLIALGLIRRHEVVDGVVVRVPCAYPMFEIGYAEACAVISDYLAQFTNLHIIGRTGGFRYYNMDHAIESGIDAAQAVVARTVSPNAMVDRELATGTDS